MIQTTAGPVLCEDDLHDHSAIAVAAQTPANRAFPIDLPSMSDDEIVTWTAQAMEEKERVVEILGEYIAAGKAEIERRLRENGGRALAHPLAEKIELEDEYSPYVYDVDALRAAKALLPEAEAAKILKHMPEQITVIPENDEPGAAVSITALIRKYGEKSEVGALLSKAMTRTKTGQRLAFKLKKAVRA